MSRPRMGNGIRIVRSWRATSQLSGDHRFSPQVSWQPNGKGNQRQFCNSFCQREGKDTYCSSEDERLFPVVRLWRNFSLELFQTMLYNLKPDSLYIMRSTRLSLRESHYKRWKYHSKSKRMERTGWHSLCTTDWCLGLSQPGAGLPGPSPQPWVLTAHWCWAFQWFPTTFPRKPNLLTRACRDQHHLAPAYTPGPSLPPTLHHDTPATLAFGKGANLSPTSNPLCLLTLPRWLNQQLLTWWLPPYISDLNLQFLPPVGLPCLPL